MGIRLDWQIESEQTNTRATEDPSARQRRIRARNQFLLLIAVLTCVLGLVVLAIVWRLRSADTQYRQDLLDTVEIETTALRLGDYPGYMAIQRSTSSAFLQEQSQAFEEYQALKEQHRVTLTGTVIDAAIDGLRGRVVVEEIIDGVPYHVVWFYWYYEDGGPTNQGGWRRVPDDLTFWGEERQIKRANVTITYHELDHMLAAALADPLNDWWVRGCALLGCVPPQPLTVEIVAEYPAVVTWASDDPWRLHITSPLVGRARADTALAPELARQVAETVAARLVDIATGGFAPPAATDAAWLVQDSARWLAETLLAGSDSSPAEPGFVGTLVAQYGPGAPMIVLSTAQQGAAQINAALLAVSGLGMSQISADQLNGLDLRGFFQARLALEMQFLAQFEGRDAMLGLYDLDDPNAAAAAYARLNDVTYAVRPVPAVRRVSIARDTQSGQTYAYVDVSPSAEDPSISETILWRVVGGTWKRAS